MNTCLPTPSAFELQWIVTSQIVTIYANQENSTRFASQFVVMIGRELVEVGGLPQHKFSSAWSELHDICRSKLEFIQSAINTDSLDYKAVLAIAFLKSFHDYYYAPRPS